nr:hypothetical protein Iba_scaffold4931CG0080 [Ipomoea batatas]
MHIIDIVTLLSLVSPQATLANSIQPRYSNVAAMVHAIFVFNENVYVVGPFGRGHMQKPIGDMKFYLHKRHKAQPQRHKAQPQRHRMPITTEAQNVHYHRGTSPTTKAYNAHYHRGTNPTHRDTKPITTKAQNPYNSSHNPNHNLNHDAAAEEKSGGEALVVAAATKLRRRMVHAGRWKGCRVLPVTPPPATVAVVAPEGGEPPLACLASTAAARCRHEE